MPLFSEGKMIHTATKKVVLGLSLGLVVSCGVFKTEEKGKKAQQMDPEIADQWKSDCVPATVLNLTHTIKDYRFSAIGDFDKREHFYNDNQCSKEIFSYQITGTYSVVGDAKMGNNAKNINYTINKVTVTPVDDSAVNILNTANFCGSSDWQKGAEKDVTGKECLGLNIDKGNVVYDIYRINKDVNPKLLYLGSNFYLGQDKSLTERPENLDEQTPLKEQ